MLSSLLLELSRPLLLLVTRPELPLPVGSLVAGGSLVDALLPGSVPPCRASPGSAHAAATPSTHAIDRARIDLTLSRVGALLSGSVSARPQALPDERSVVERARKGDRRAFETIYRAYASTIYGYVLVPMLGDRDDAHDCLRETFLSAHKALADYEWREPGIYAWLKVLAKNKARDLLRASGRRQRLRGAFAEHVDALSSDGAPATPGEEEVQRAQLRSQIERVLETMNPRYAEVLRLRLLEDRAREDCAEQMDVKIGTLDVLLYRACKAFRQACEKQGVALRLELR